MPKESGKKMQELLRVLFLEGGAHSRPSLAARLGLSESSLDVAVREAHKLFSATMDEVMEEDRGKYKVTRLRYEQFRRCRNVLAQLYRTRTIRQQEKKRLVLVIIDGSSRDMGTSYELINNIIIPHLEKKDRMQVARNRFEDGL